MVRARGSGDRGSCGHAARGRDRWLRRCRPRGTRKENEHLFKQLPSFPGARLDSETSTAYRSSDLGPVIGYGTRFDLTLPPAATTASVSSFFRQRPRPQWRLVEDLEGQVFNFRSRKASVSINLANAHVHVLEVAVDQAYYGKLGS